MPEQISDRRAEGEQRDRLLGDLTPDDCWRATPFNRWTPLMSSRMASLGRSSPKRLLGIEIPR